MKDFNRLFEKIRYSEIVNRDTVDSLVKTVKIANIEINSAIIWLRRIIESNIKNYCKDKIELEKKNLSKTYSFYDYLKHLESLGNILPNDVLNDIHRTRLYGNRSAHRALLDEDDFEIAFMVTIKIVEWIEKNTSKIIIGIDVGTSKIVGAIARVKSSNEFEILNHNNKEVMEKVECRDFVNRPNILINQLAGMVHRLIDKCEQISGVNKGYIKDLGIGLPGQISKDKEELTYSPGFHIFSFPVKKRLQQKLKSMNIDLNIIIENNVRCSSLAELLSGNGSKYNDFINISIGTGVGGGLVLNGQLIEGYDNIAGELGHMTINFENGRKCKCGRKGCLEAYVSGYAIEKRLKELLENVPKSNLLLKKVKELEGNQIVKLIPQFAEKGDPVCSEIVDELGTSLGTALANLANIINPEAILLGGGIIKGFYDLIADKLLSTFDENTLSKGVKIEEIKFVENSSLFGTFFLHQYKNSIKEQLLYSQDDTYSNDEFYNY